MTSNSETKLIIPGLTGIYETFGPLSFALLRFAFGATLFWHGYFKLFHGVAPIVANKILTPMGFPAPLAWAYWLGVLEFFGGAMIAFGLLTRPIALLLVIEMIIVTFGWNFRFGFFFTAPGGGWEFPLALLTSSILFLFYGGGRYSIDRTIGKEF